jgi:predicted DNA-binding transcriptional regulator YafY
MSSIIADANQRGESVEITYRKEGDTQVRELRVVTPIELRASAAGDDYVVAYDHDRSEPRSFRTDRIEDIRVLSINEKLLLLYEDSGQQAVWDWVREYHSEWPWRWCEPCEDYCPIYEGACAVCWTEHPDGHYND